ncbi:MAG: hypothetical protein AAGA28_04680 [Pseudomonadota bacterium]
MSSQSPVGKTPVERGFCLTELSIFAAVALAIAVSVLVWLAILAVI